MLSPLNILKVPLHDFQTNLKIFFDNNKNIEITD